jgi:hypothetical protein
MKFAGLVLALFVASSAAYSPVLNRREVFQSIAAATAVVASPSIADALEACPKGSSNCIRTTWTPPSGTSKDAAVATLRKVLESYPTEGQNKVDLGGWTLVEDNFTSGSARLEYKSGLGNFAKFFNGGKPFVDDLKLEIADSGVVEVKSASRVGDSDLGVNEKRLSFLVAKLREEGWTTPEPAY